MKTWQKNDLEDNERQRLSVVAMWSEDAIQRFAQDEERAVEYRLSFQRDRDRILHSRAFRRLKHKTQVFVPHLADHSRTRLTHTLEVAQIGRTLARALGLNEDLVEAIALGHDLGHTAFGHTGETVLKEILTGHNIDVLLPEAVTASVGTFKHNYQSVRVVDLLEWRYSKPGLNLSDQVREGILKHTRWRVGFPFPLVDAEGLRLRHSCHLEGQVVAIADEIAQQTHDLEDGLRAGSVELASIEELTAARLVVSRLGQRYVDEKQRWLRQSMIVRGLIDLLVNDVIITSAGRIEALIERLQISNHARFLECLAEISQSTISFSGDLDSCFLERKDFIYRFIINHPHVNRQDWRARKVVGALFKAYWKSPLNLPAYVLMRARDELGLPFLRDLPISSVAVEVSEGYHPNAGFARLVADHIAGMSDRFALEEYRSLEQPSPDQLYLGDLR